MADQHREAAVLRDRCAYPHEVTEEEGRTRDDLQLPGATALDVGADLEETAHEKRYVCTCTSNAITATQQQWLHKNKWQEPYFARRRVDK